MNEQILILLVQELLIVVLANLLTLVHVIENELTTDMGVAGLLFDGRNDPA